MFAEDLAVFFGDVDGFSIAATVDGSTRSVIFDAPGAEAMGGELVTSEPSVLLSAEYAPAEGDAVVFDAADLPGHLLQLAGTYTVRSVMPEPPDGALVRAYLAKT